MSGGAYEYVMGVYATNGSPTKGSSGFEGFPDSKYYNLYTTKNNLNIGDALYETNGWNSDQIIFVNSVYPFFIRGGSCYRTSDTGIFAFNYNNGKGSSGFGFRVCLTI